MENIRAYRRRMKYLKDKQLREVIRNRYVPHVGYFHYSVVNGEVIVDNRYIRYPKRSKIQRYAKRQTNRIVRKQLLLPSNPAGYRKYFDYWWEMY